MRAAILLIMMWAVVIVVLLCVIAVRVHSEPVTAVSWWCKSQEAVESLVRVGKSKWDALFKRFSLYGECALAPSYSPYKAQRPKTILKEVDAHGRVYGIVRVRLMPDFHGGLVVYSTQVLTGQES